MQPVHDLKIVLHSAAVAAGATDIVPPAGVDCTGFGGVTFVVAFGAIVTGAATTIKAQSSSDDGAVDTYDDIKGSMITVPDTADGKLFLLDITEPDEKFVKCIVGRATQNATVNSIIAILHTAKVRPVSQDSNVGATLSLISQPKGTA
jgi:hypothetical protein